MKKIGLFLIIFFISITNIKASEKLEVELKKCIDGDTASVVLDNKDIKIRFLAIDTPETKHPTKGEEPYGKKASEYTCEALKKASKIEIEYDKNSDKLDKYDRHLVWIFVDNKLLQQSLIEKGLAKVAYLYGDYKYTSVLEEKELQAKLDKVGIWSDFEIDYTKIILAIIIVIVIIILFICNQKFRKKTTNKIKRNAKNKLKKLFKN